MADKSSQASIVTGCRCMNHLKKIFSINGREQAWVDCRKHPLMLSIRSVELIGRNLCGTADVAIVTRQAKRIEQPQMGLEVFFLLKKEPREGHNMYQAQASLLSANIHSATLKPIMVSSLP